MDPAWRFREYEPVGIDLAGPDAVAAYDRNQGTDAARDDALLDRLGATSGMRLVDLACGTGSLVVRAALRGLEAHGVDVAPHMLAFAKARADRAGARAHWHHAGFLDHEHRSEPADIVTTKAALHQLPDFWKQQALLNAASMLRPGGTLYLWDVVFTFPPSEADRHLQGWIDTAGRPEGLGFTRADFEAHVREEFSTYGWILEGMLERAGFDIVAHIVDSPVHSAYECRLARPVHELDAQRDKCNMQLLSDSYAKRQEAP
ncbi:class I SAM-dependent methyltransferase [Streptomyces sp. NBC_00006]|uniref:class I SAM-dependent methyltransferase n=1 Tax=unclassified Streptomyces TaxID=2593676 RepID=UPI00225A0591|nr:MULTISPECIES: class I SAM-dependent methyltransferase [unclassified Streptomyces]MCX5530696.1 class I SAM-dependent methyltransferase [Streptomyces sp. NBC_00006]